jgi:hypothetical protein
MIRKPTSHRPVNECSLRHINALGSGGELIAIDVVTVQFFDKIEL